jgi:hypothetical protein
MEIESVAALRRENGGPNMHAVVVRSTLHDDEQGRSFLREQAIPRIRQAPGFVTAHWVRLAENSGTSMLIFETEEAAQAAVEQLKSNPPPTSAVTINSVEVGEVVEHA